MKQDDFEAYKKAIRQHYEKEKVGIYSGFLLQPSRANLRNLCIERFKESSNTDDLNTFKIFMGFEFKPELKNRLKEETDRFRVIENFLKGSTDSNDIETINLSAILVDFAPRPFLKFVKYHKGEEIVAETPKAIDNYKDSKIDYLDKNNNTTSKNKLIFAVLGIVALFSIGYTAKDLVLPKKDCMQWQKDQYVEVDCQDEINSLYSSSTVVPFDENTSMLRKLQVSDTTTFYKGGKAIIWYCKVDGLPEFFDRPGFHPITGKGLKPITDYIIDKYIKNKQ